MIDNVFLSDEELLELKGGSLQASSYSEQGFQMGNTNCCNVSLPTKGK